MSEKAEKKWEELHADYVEWLDNVDEERLLDQFDLALGWFSGKGLDHEYVLNAAEFMRDHGDKDPKAWWGIYVCQRCCPSTSFDVRRNEAEGAHKEVRCPLCMNPCGLVLSRMATWEGRGSRSEKGRI